MKKLLLALVCVGGCEGRDPPPYMGPSEAPWTGQVNTPESVRMNNGDAGLPPPAPTTTAKGSGTGTPRSTGTGGGPVVGVGTPSGYFLLSKERLAELRAGVNSSAWSSLLNNVALASRQPTKEPESAENVALAYLVTRDPKLAALAFKLYKIRTEKGIGFDSYLRFGDLMAGAAMVLNYCADALSAGEQKEIADFLEKSAEELWFHNKGSGWGLADAGNNYYCAFVEGTAYVAYGLKAARRPSAKKWLDLLTTKIEGPKGALAYFAGQGKGGNWHEGANYGERSKERYFAAFAVIASMGGPNYFTRSPFTAESIYYAIYQVQPGRQFIAPDGDLARDAIMDVTPFDRDYIQLASHWVDDARARGLAAWYMRDVSPRYDMDNVRALGSFHRDVILGSPGPVLTPDKLPLHYRSQGTEWINARSSWMDSAVSLTFNGTTEVTQSHAHADTGSFVIWRGGWQAADAGSYGKSGLHQTAGAHNMIQVNGKGVSGNGKSRGLVHFGDDDTNLYAQIDASNLFTRRLADDSHETLLEEWTRELVYVRPDVFFVYDRVVPKAGGKDWSWRVHLPRKPVSPTTGRFFGSNERGSISVDVLDSGEAKVREDSDLEGGPTTAWRIEVGPTPSGRVLAVLRVAGATAPNVPSEGFSAPGIQGAASGNQVAVFSTQPQGRPAALPFTYKIKGLDKHQHTLVNMAGPCDAVVSREGGSVTVKVSAGSKYRPDEHGVVRFSD